MGLLNRMVLREVAASALLGIALFTFVLFLQRLGRLFEMLVRSSAAPSDIAALVALLFPLVLTFTVPVGVLVGVLVVLSRMSSDGEITAMRSAGVAGTRLAGPIFLLATFALLVTAAASLWLTPWSIRQSYRTMGKLAAGQITAEIQPRIFEEQFPRTVLFVQDLVAGEPVRWRKLFLADLSAPEERTSGAREAGEGLRITVAREAVVVPDTANQRLQLSMISANSYEAGKNPIEYFSSFFPKGDQTLEARRREEMQNRRGNRYSEMDTASLYRELGSSVDAQIEFHQRLVLPFACVLLALVGIPLGVSSRKGGKSGAFITTVLIAFLYYMGLIALIGLAKQGTMPASIALWIPNSVLLLSGFALTVRMEAASTLDILGGAREWVVRAWRRASSGISRDRGGRLWRTRKWLAPTLVDTYVLTSFFYYLGLMLVTFVLLAHVFTFFELLGDIIKNRIPMHRVGTYLFFLTPQLIYDSAPISILVASLATFGVLMRNNEVTALKACGVSVHRLVTPVLLASGVLSLLLFAFDHYYVADANIIQDAIRNEIKNRPIQTYLRPDRKWVFGKQSRIYYYRYFDPAERVMGDVRVFGLDPATFELKRHISAERARWEPNLKTWVFQNGWVRDIEGTRVVDFNSFQASTFKELDEAPDYFLKEVRQEKQMNFIELDRYIGELQQSGLDTVKLRVQYHKKFSVPLFALIMAMLAAPFAFMTGSRGVLAAAGVSFIIAVAYWSVSRVFEELGKLNELPAALAAWAPDGIFVLIGLYLLSRIRT